MLTSELQCNALYLDNSLPQIDGISVGNLSGKSAQEMNQAFAPHRGKFIRFNNVQTLKRQNRNFCLVSSAEIADDIAPIDVEFPDIKSHYLSRIVDVVI